MRRYGIYTVLAAILMTSCSKEDIAQKDFPDGEVLAVITGTVTDMDSTPIEHIKVTIQWGQETKAQEVYTSSEGRFRSERIIKEGSGTNTLTIILEDIDGEENGGLFESHTESMLLEQDDAEEPASLELDFRLNHATASENSPQSSQTAYGN